MPDAPGLRVRFSAFISYSHQDAAFARRLHGALERHRLPRHATHARATAPDGRHLLPVFIDRAELSSSSDLDEAIREAIDASACLVVVCSPAASKSPWVGREIAYFRARHGHQGILTALVAGTPDDAFHPELTHAEDGRALVPLAADFRPQGDGPRLAYMKLVSGISGLPLDRIVQRETQRRIRTLAAVAMGSVFAAALALGLAAWALHERSLAEAERARGENVIEYMITGLRQRLERVGRLEVLSEVNARALGYYQGQDLARMPPESLRRRAEVLHAIGEDEEKRGHLPAARAQFVEARRTTRALLDAAPADADTIFAHAQSEYWMAFICWREADDACAEAGFEQYARLARRLVDVTGPKLDSLLEVAYADSNLGAYRLRRFGDVPRARAHFESALGHFMTAAAQNPKDNSILEEIADGYGWLADCERVAGRAREARALRRKQRDILDKLLAQDPLDYTNRGAVAGNEFALARISLDEHAPTRALVHLAASHALTRRLAEEDPDNAATAAMSRALDLMEARVRLALPRSVTQARKVDSLLGDCTPGTRGNSVAELVALCHLLRAKRLQQQGLAAEAQKALASPVLLHTLTGSRLTERWLFDLALEMARLGIANPMDTGRSRPARRSA